MTTAELQLAPLSPAIGAGGWILGNAIDGTQAPVRLLQADGSLYSFLAGESDEALVMFNDALPTALSVG